MPQPTLAHSNGRGPFHFLLIPGLVPDGPETFLRQAAMLHGFGSSTTFTYPYEDYDLDQVLAAIGHEVDKAHGAGKWPVLIGVSVGGGLCLEWLRRRRDQQQALNIRALILVSPLTCLKDLSSLLGRIFESIIKEHERGPEGDPDAALERGRSFFKQLASRSVTVKDEKSGWKKVLGLLTPQGIQELRERKIRKRIDATLAGVSPKGAMARVMSLRHFVGLDAKPKGPLAEVPTLLLWGSKERQTLNMDGPGTSQLCRPDLAYRYFPDCEVHWLYAADGSEVPHASLLKHASSFNKLMRRFLKRVIAREKSKLPLLQRGLMPFLAKGEKK